MPTLKRTFLSLAALALLPLAACKDSSGPDRRLSGEARFTYTGDVSGRFEAEGRVTPSNFDDGTFAFAQRGTDEEGNDFLLIYAQEGRDNSSRYDGLLMAVDEPAEGSVSCTEDDLECRIFSSFVLGATEVGGGDSEAMFFSTGGTVTITDLTDNRVKGTFQMPMAGFIGDGAEGEVQVSAGSFDLPLLDEGDAPFSRGQLNRAGTEPRGF